MIRTLQKKFVFTAMAAITVLLPFKEERKMTTCPTGRSKENGVTACGKTYPDIRGTWLVILEKCTQRLQK